MQCQKYYTMLHIPFLQSWPCQARCPDLTILHPNKQPSSQQTVLAHGSCGYALLFPWKTPFLPVVVSTGQSSAWEGNIFIILLKPTLHSDVTQASWKGIKRFQRNFVFTTRTNQCFPGKIMPCVFRQVSSSGISLPLCGPILWDNAWGAREKLQQH